MRSGHEPASFRRGAREANHDGIDGCSRDRHTSAPSSAGSPIGPACDLAKFIASMISIGDGVLEAQHFDFGTQKVRSSGIPTNSYRFGGLNCPNAVWLWHLKIF